VSVMPCAAVLAVVTLGLVMSKHRTSVSTRVQQSLSDFWRMIGYIANSLIFAVSGVLACEKIFGSHVSSIDIAWIIVLFIVLHVARALMVGVSLPVMKVTGYAVTKAEAAVLWFGGLRGGLALILAVSTSQETVLPADVRDRIVFHVSCQTILTLCVNGSLCKPLVHWLHLDAPSPTASRIMAEALIHLKLRIAAQISSMQSGNAHTYQHPSCF
jgi:NhaP-type Na+/H+ or K+/H+ antiporter